jgi:hypothetical protein
MNDLTGMYDDSSDLETRLEAASHLLKQAADEQGVDLDSFSEEDLSNMLTEIVSDQGEGGGEGGDEGGGDAGGGDEGKTASDITVADVSFELTKRAAAEGVDLSELDPEEYSEIFDKVAMEMTNPEYVEEQQKLAEQIDTMDELGRIAARGFVDEINKLAGDDDDDEDDEDKKKRRAEAFGEKKAAIKDKAKALYEGAKAVGGKAVNKAGRAERRVSEAVGRATSKNKSQNFEQMQNRGRKVLGGAVGVGAAGTGAGVLATRKKKASLEDAALVADAIDVLRAAGYDL